MPDYHSEISDLTNRIHRSSGSSSEDNPINEKKRRRFSRKRSALYLIFLSFAELVGRFARRVRADREMRYNMYSAHTKFRKIIHSFISTVKISALAFLKFIKVSVPIVAPVLGIAIIAFSVWGLSTYSVGLHIMIGNSAVYVETADEFNRIQGEVQDRIVSNGEEYITDTLPTIRMVLVKKDCFTSSKDIADILMANYDDYVGQSYGFFLDGKLIATSKSGSDFDVLIETLSKAYLSGDEGETYKVLNSIEIVRDAYDGKKEMLYDELEALFTSSENNRTYSVKKKDSLSSIATKFGLSVPELKLLNFNKNFDSLPVGMELNIGTLKYKLDIQTSSSETYNEVIPYETKYLGTDTMYDYMTIVKNEGSNGIYEVTAEVVCVNGVETSREIVEKKKIKDAITRQVYVGTIPVAPSGSMIFPLEKYSFKSSSFGWRTLRGKPGFHRGVDLAASYGTKIYAAEDGVVYKKAWQNSGLGNYIAIDHENGIISYYGHCSKLVESIDVGDKVSKGALIAYVGSTGNSTGNHLHFALYNTTTKEYFDPEPYIFKK